MTTRTVAWAMFGTSMALTAAALALLAVTFDVPVPDSWGFRGFTATFAVTFCTVGLVIVSARRHVIGWILLLSGLEGAIQCFAEQYAIYGVLAHPGSLPFPQIFGWINSWIWVVAVLSVGIYVPLLFPNGRFLSPRWRLVGAAALFFALFLGVSLALTEGPLNNAPYIDNPFGIPGFRALDARTFGADWPFVVGYGGLVLSAVAAIASVVLRFGAARGMERQQLKWLAFGGGLVAIGFAAGAGLQEQSKLGQFFFIATLQIVPLSVAVAVLRYRLYDVDVLINRTLVYGATVTIVGALFVAAALVLQTLLRPFTAGSDIAIAGSTLATVAAFQPLRRRVQAAIDRRFYRSRYDASRTLDAFVARLRDEVGMEQVRGELLDVVATTVRPAHASVWLREVER